MNRRRNNRAFTLIELLVVVAIIALLAATSLAGYSAAMKHANCALCTSRMRSIGVAFINYAGDNDNQLPARVQTGDKWPVLLLPYVEDPKTYADPSDAYANKFSPDQLAIDSANNGSFFMNGFNDLGFYTNPTATVRLVNLTQAGNLIILAEQKPGANNFYMDFIEGNESTILNKTTYFGGSNYVFADGSVRFMTESEYSDSMWLVNPNFQIP
jgi:prepilin-type N-terminal cleavage/methylation domain-containing protein/prepilin-type processing-associated H-X9-DG protein